MSAPLEGIRIVEIASWVAAPAAGALLADMGAEVIKVEVPRGEIYRWAFPRMLGFDSDFLEAPHFQMDNRGKRSLTLDLTKPAARDALLRVIDTADIVLTNMLPQRLQKFGLDAETLRSKRPELIFAEINGYGSRGDEATKPAFDYAAYWARTGFMDILHEPDAPPAFQRPGIGDHAAALALVSGILAALRVRDRTGVGQVVETCLLHVGFYIQGNDAAMSLVANQTPPRHDRRTPMNPLWNHYPTKDERWVFLAMIESDAYWPRLCEALGRTDLLGREEFGDMMSRMRNSAALTAELGGVFAQRTLAEWESHLANSSVIWAPVRTLGEAIQDPQARVNDIFQKVQHPSAGEYETIAPPVKLSGHEMRGTRPAPMLGADNQAILRAAGLSDEEIAAALS